MTGITYFKETALERRLGEAYKEGSFVTQGKAVVAELSCRLRLRVLDNKTKRVRCKPISDICSLTSSGSPSPSLWMVFETGNWW